jgi:hypothetical protein
MHELIDGWLDDCLNGQTEGCLFEWINGWLDGLMDGWMDEWIDECMDG